MKLLIKLVTLAVASFALIGTAAQAQFVKGNEAVKVTATGTKVETPPAQGRTGKLCRAVDPTVTPVLGAWSRPMRAWWSALSRSRATGTCRASTYGTQKLSRLWVVKTKTTWLQCQYPDLGSKCVAMFARPPANLPLDAIQ